MLPIYGPEFEVNAEERIRGYVLNSSDLPALNQIPKAKFRIGTLNKLSYSSDSEKPPPRVAREDGFPNRTFLKDKVGMVRVKKAGGDWVRADENMDLAIGDMVKTLSNGKAQVVLAGTAVIRVKPDSEFIIPENKANTKEKVSFLQFLKGMLWAKAKKEDDSLKVGTPNWITAVRGTEFVVEVKGGEREEPTTCAYCYEGKVAVWKKTARDTEGTLVAELVAGQSVCVGPRGVIKPVSEGGPKPEPGTCSFAGQWDVSYYDSPKPTGQPTRKVRMKIEVSGDQATGYEELRGTWVKALAGLLTEKAQVWNAQQKAGGMVVMTVANIRFDPNCDRIVGEWSGAMPHHNAWIGVRVGSGPTPTPTPGPQATQLPKKLTVELSNQNREPTVRVASGAQLTVKVATYAGTGYEMRMVPPDRTAVSLVGGPSDELMSKAPASKGKVIVGQGTWKVYELKVVDRYKGRFQLKFQFSRGRGKVEVEYTLTVNVGS